MKTVRLYNFDFVNAPDHGPVLEYLDNRTKSSDKLPFLITPNVDQLVKYAREENKMLQRTLAESELCLPDGQPIVWTSKWKRKGDKLQSRLTGSDLFPAMWGLFKSTSKRVFFILPSAEIGESICNEYAQSAYFAPPYFSVDDAPAYQAVLKSCVSEIKAFKPDHVLIGLGFPKQEILALDIHKECGDMDIFYSLLGASFEFYLGKKSRAPKWMQRNGLEFLHRLLSEPGRMAKRYLVDDVAFFPMLLRELRRP